MKHLIVIAVLIVGGQTYWTPCERGAIFCPHFNNWGTDNIEGHVKVNVNTTNDDEDEDLVISYASQQGDAPSTVVEGVYE